MSDEKVYISAQQLLEDSLELGRQIIASGFRPNFIVGVWRGGTPVGITVQELLDFYGVETDHISIRTSSYSGLDERREGRVRVHGLGYLEQQMNAEDSLLIVDDVFDTGLSVKAIIDKLRRARAQEPAARSSRGDGVLQARQEPHRLRAGLPRPPHRRLARVPARDGGAEPDRDARAQAAPRPHRRRARRGGGAGEVRSVEMTNPRARSGVEGCAEGGTRRLGKTAALGGVGRGRGVPFPRRRLVEGEGVSSRPRLRGVASISRSRGWTP